MNWLYLLFEEKMCIKVFLLSSHHNMECLWRIISYNSHFEKKNFIYPVAATFGLLFRHHCANGFHNHIFAKFEYVFIDISPNFNVL